MAAGRLARRGGEPQAGCSGAPPSVSSQLQQGFSVGGCGSCKQPAHRRGSRAGPRPSGCCPSGCCPRRPEHVSALQQGFATGDCGCRAASPPAAAQQLLPHQRGVVLPECVQQRIRLLRRRRLRRRVGVGVHRPGGQLGEGRGQQRAVPYRNTNPRLQLQQGLSIGNCGCRRRRRERHSASCNLQYDFTKLLQKALSLPLCRRL